MRTNNKVKSNKFNVYLSCIWEVNAIDSVFDLVKEAEETAARLTAQAKATISAERKAMQEELDKKSALYEERLSALQADLSEREKAQIDESGARLDKEWTDGKALLDKKYEMTRERVRALLKGKVFALNGDS